MNDEEKRILKEVISRSNVIGWYKPDDCEVCGQGANLCHDPRCPSNMAFADYYRKRDQILNRTWLQRLAARILNEG